MCSSGNFKFAKCAVVKVREYVVKNFKYLKIFQ